jgi:hypothetical protein
MKATIIALLLVTVLISSCTLFATTEDIAGDDTTNDGIADVDEEIVKEIDDIEMELADDIDLDELDF